jgi:alkanesulfonate monooxygenase SsuD/methylene tetrahydromethanopterin reductase-like flavin-dependent oxidoreductase (luciferase family)
VLIAAGGASTLWIACHLYLRDPFTMAALPLGATRRIKVALMAMSPASMPPSLPISPIDGGDIHHRL